MATALYNTLTCPPYIDFATVHPEELVSTNH